MKTWNTFVIKVSIDWEGNDATKIQPRCLRLQRAAEQLVHPAFRGWESQHKELGEPCEKDELGFSAAQQWPGQTVSVSTVWRWKWRIRFCGPYPRRWSLYKDVTLVHMCLSVWQKVVENKASRLWSEKEKATLSRSSQCHHGTSLTGQNLWTPRKKIGMGIICPFTRGRYQ